MPGTRKSVKGECSKIDTGNPPNNSHEGEIIKAIPPPIAPNARNASKTIRIFCADKVFIAF